MKHCAKQSQDHAQNTAAIISAQSGYYSGSICKHKHIYVSILVHQQVKTKIYRTFTRIYILILYPPFQTSDPKIRLVRKSSTHKARKKIDMRYSVIKNYREPEQKIIVNPVQQAQSYAWTKYSLRLFVCVMS